MFEQNLAITNFLKDYRTYIFLSKMLSQVPDISKTDDYDLFSRFANITSPKDFKLNVFEARLKSINQNYYNHNNYNIRNLVAEATL